LAKGRTTQSVQAAGAAFQKTAQALSGFVSLQRQGRQAARLRVLSILLAVADEVIDESRDVCFWPIVLKKSSVATHDIR
jgi:hypothetical protein